MQTDNTYGFLTNLPPETREEYTVQVPMCGVPPWCTTAMVGGARNHCASVMAANMLLMLQGWAGPVPALAAQAYERIGPGPIARGLACAAAFLQSNGVRTVMRRVCSQQALAAELQLGRPAALLVVGPRMHRDWHWVAVCGFTRLEDKRIFWHIADGWHESTRFFMQGRGSRWIMGGAFRKTGG